MRTVQITLEEDLVKAVDIWLPAGSANPARRLRETPYGQLWRNSSCKLANNNTEKGINSIQ
jgi:hypothetical protein